MLRLAGWWWIAVSAIHGLGGIILYFEQWQAIALNYAYLLRLLLFSIKGNPAIFKFHNAIGYIQDTIIMSHN